MPLCWAHLVSGTALFVFFIRRAVQCHTKIKWDKRLRCLGSLHLVLKNEWIKYMKFLASRLSTKENITLCNYTIWEFKFIQPLQNLPLASSSPQTDIIVALFWGAICHITAGHQWGIVGLIPWLDSVRGCDSPVLLRARTQSVLNAVRSIACGFVGSTSCKFVFPG